MNYKDLSPGTLIDPEVPVEGFSCWYMDCDPSLFPLPVQDKILVLVVNQDFANGVYASEHRHAFVTIRRIS